MRWRGWSHSAEDGDDRPAALVRDALAVTVTTSGEAAFDALAWSFTSAWR